MLLCLRITSLCDWFRKYDTILHERNVQLMKHGVYLAGCEVCMSPLFKCCLLPGLYILLPDRISFRIAYSFDSDKSPSELTKAFRMRLAGSEVTVIISRVNRYPHMLILFNDEIGCNEST